MLNQKFSEIIPIETLQQSLEQFVTSHRPDTRLGQVATYIPELAKANRDHLAVAVCLMNGDVIEAGDSNVPLTMQSISKVVSLALALIDHGPREVFKRVGKEPTGDPFNSIVKLETIRPNRPLNPMINAGAIAVTTLIEGQGVDHKFERLLHFVRRLTGNPDITYNTKVARSESETSNLNRSLAYFMREHGVFNGDIEEILALYFKQCAIELNCRDLARLGAVLANNGRDIGGEKLIPADVARICKTFMVTCGMYNASGEFAIEVGIPAKSGVSGGILASVPYHMGIGVLGPALNDKGNSVAGIQILKKISEKWDLSIF